jgi:aminocarboxymuconate-semialdehyde decarboxylase
MIIGTDYPFNFHERAPLAAIEAAGFDEATRELLLRTNARRFLGIDQ